MRNISFIPDESFELGFMFFLHKNGYLGEDIFTEKNKWKVDKYMDEYLKVYSWEKKNEFL